jgi:hypothetical protein
MKKKYTVLLLYAHIDRPETYQAHVYAASVKQAIFFARFEISKANDNPDARDDYDPIAVYLGHLEDLSE